MLRQIKSIKRADTRGRKEKKEEEDEKMEEGCLVNK